MRTLLKQGTIVSLSSAGEVLHDSDVLIEDDRIARIFRGAAPRDLQADRVLGCAGKIVLPGLVSAHTHLTGMFQRGLWDETSFESWSRKSSATEKAFAASPEDIYLIHSAACIELIRHGVTTVLNMFTIPPRDCEAYVDSAWRALSDSGIRGVLALSFKDQSPNNPDIATDAPAGDSWIDLARDVARRAGLESRLSLMLAPSAPQRCSNPLLERCKEAAAELGVGIHTHLAETRRHAEIGRQLYGKPIVNHLEEIGFLGPDVSMAHSIWLEDEELDILERHDVKIVHNPSSNMKLGSGVARVKKMLARGLTVGLGADSVNAATVYSIFEQMKLAVLLPRTHWNSDEWILPAEALEMGTLGGAKAALLDGAIGSIEEGKKADVVILNPSVFLQPANDLVSELALCENGSSVESVFVDGRSVMLEGKMTEVDEEAILSEFASMSDRIARAKSEVLQNL
ncbi:MAG TPA: amidohydrolase [Candidatus Binatia bacterium]|jgi:5-methylthioadenosine/S-adenosylhomocysteine deaminase